ncbi:nucleotidyltransferase domain-containing protein [Frankia sp. AgB32]|uniref:DNA polymerase beta superfamily protein n=1 Tax=Frankia sp. AgB32 TaxID=631119 RepID=UPI00200D6807|nr:nucleotidyltransferase domain-containing protein [Frankia sp. AgB32]MCK9898138.1 nucleotidyltransferase domain-containing protein [Frankia sp. AgB32]
MTETDLRPNVDYGPSDAARAGEILRSVVGSTVHGTNLVGQDDIDQLGVYIPPPEHLFGVVEPPRSGTHVWRTQPEGARSGPGDIDLTIFTVRRFLALATSGNPTIIALFYTPDDALVVRTEEGDRLRALAPAVVSQQAGRRFLGYLHSQLERMDGKGKQNRVPNRPELVARHGWDVKYGSHAFRLGLQGIELLTTGRLALPMEPEAREQVLAMRRGDVPLDRARLLIADAAVRLHGLLDDPDLHRRSPLRDRPTARCPGWVSGQGSRTGGRCRSTPPRWTGRCRSCPRTGGTLRGSRDSR